MASTLAQLLDSPHSTIAMYNTRFSLACGFCDRDDGRCSSTTLLRLKPSHIFRHTTELELSLVEFSDPMHLILAIRAFPALVRISLAACLGVNGVAPVPATWQLPTSLRILGLEISARCILHWLCAHETLPALHTLRIHTADLKLLPLIDIVLRSLHSSLLTLHMDVYFGPINLSEQVYQDINLSQLTHLRNIFLSMGICTGVTPLVFNNLVSLMSQVTSCHMEEITLHLFSPGLADLERLDWDLLASVIERPQFHSLRKLSFQLSYRLGIDAIFLIKERLAACNARGILHFLRHCQ